MTHEQLNVHSDAADDEDSNSDISPDDNEVQDEFQNDTDQNAESKDNHEEEKDIFKKIY